MKCEITQLDLEPAKVGGSWLHPPLTHPRDSPWLHTVSPQERGSTSLSFHQQTACAPSQVSVPVGNRWFPPPNCLQEDTVKKRLLTREERKLGHIRQVWEEKKPGIRSILYDGVWGGGRRGQKGAAVWVQASDKGSFFLRELGQCPLS